MARTRKTDQTTEASTAVPAELEGAGTNGTAQEPSASGRSALERIMEEEGFELTPLELQPRLEERFGIVMNTSTISSTKSQIMKKRGMKGKKRKRRSGPKAEGATPAPRKTQSEQTIEDIRQLKQLLQRHGAGWIQQVLDLLGA